MYTLLSCQFYSAEDGESVEVEMTDDDIIALMMPNNENPGQNNARVCRARYGETVRGQVSVYDKFTCYTDNINFNNL